MESVFSSFLLVFISEMGDKTQLLSLVLISCYKKPWVILSGITVATLLNHALASYLGVIAALQVSPEILKWSLASIFFIFAVWILIPDKEEELKSVGRFGVFLTTLVAFFIAEMGDKTQLATVALGARFNDAMLVTVGSTAGMVASNALAVFLGEKVLKIIPMKWVRAFASMLFILFGFIIIFKM